MYLGFCQTQIVSVVKQKWEAGGEEGSFAPRQNPLQILLSRHWTRAWVNSEEGASREAGVGNLSEERCQEVPPRVCLGAGFLPSPRLG